jgi:hypothetical protein
LYIALGRSKCVGKDKMWFDFYENAYEDKKWINLAEDKV